MPMYTACPRYSSPVAPKEPAPTPDLALAQFMSLLNPILSAASAAPQVPRQARTPRTLPVFTPKFHVQETASEYVLEGEFPGLSDKSKLDIQFTDHKTLVVRGALEKAVIAAPNETTGAAAPPAHEEAIVPASPRQKSLNPTVEDTYDESDNASVATSGEFEVISAPSSKKRYAESPAPVSESPTVNKSKTWLLERTFGPFQRSFSFPGLIDIENVSAGLEAGLLRIVVPKIQSSSRKIVIT